MKITALTENTTKKENMEIEHGLSLYIEVDGKKILFDMGQTDTFAKNAEELGIDLAKIDLAILSHGHYDHGGGLAEFLRINKKAPVYINRNAFGEHYNGTKKYIGLDKKLKESPRLVFTDETCKLSPALTLDACNQRKRAHTGFGKELTEKRGDAFVPDEFLHEQYLLVEENGKRVLISGCSHKGILNIVDWFEPDVLIGGFHFSKLELGEELTSAAKYLTHKSCRFYTCHCTGEAQFEFIKSFIPDMNYLSCGESIEI